MTNDLVLVTGANGFVGSALCRRLHAAGHRVRAVVRPGREPAEADFEVQSVAEIGEATDWRGLLAGVDAVVHAAARVHVLKETAADPLEAFRRVNVVGSARLARQAAEAGVRRLVFLSSIGAAIAADAARNGMPPTPYQRSKWEAENALAQAVDGTGLELVILRPPLVYGPGVRGNLMRLMRLIDRGVPLPLANVRNRRSLIGLSNLCDVIEICLQRPEATGQTLDVADETVSTPDLVRRIARALDRPARLWPCPLALLQLAGRILGRRAAIEGLTGSLDLDTERTRRLLDWSPRVPMDQELTMAAKTWRGEQATT